MTHASPLKDLWAARSARFEPADSGEVAAHVAGPDQEYRRARESAGLVDLCHRTKIELTGTDRVRFLNNLCTNDVRALQAGQGCEAFVTSVQGKLVGHVFVFAADTSLVLDSAAGQAQRLCDHFDKYLITEDVHVIDRTAAWAELFLTGPDAQRVLRSAARASTERKEESADLPAAPLQHAPAVLAQQRCWLRRVDLCGDTGYQVVLPAGDARRVAEALLEAGAEPVGSRAFDTLRIEAGTPLYGADMTEENLPQEVGRNAQCISFTKGCYLGQETVARIDSRGHVNRSLVGLRLESDARPEPGTPLLHEGKEVGHVSSAAASPRLGVIALGYVRRGHETPGRQLEFHDADTVTVARVTALPFV
jgi:folate-binding protein YgfZ